MITKHAEATPTRKRTHLKPAQLEVLQDTFSKNPLPDSSIRARIAKRLGVTERTVQIWFQNRRAKARKMEALSQSLESPSIAWERPVAPPRYQPTFRTMMTPECFDNAHATPAAAAVATPVEQQQTQQSVQHQQENQQQRRRPRSSSKPEPKVSTIQAAPSMATTTRAKSEEISPQGIVKKETG